MMVARSSPATPDPAPRMLAASQLELARRVDEACLNAWPALSVVLHDGWLLRFADGHTRRANSVNPVSPGTRELKSKVAYCEKVYAARGLPAIFRVPTFAEPRLDDVLVALGYGSAEDETRVLYRRMAAGLAIPDEGPPVEILAGAPNEEWLAAHQRVAGHSDDAALLDRRILRNLAVPSAFAVARGGDGAPGAVAFGAVHAGLLVVNAVVTDPALRRRGLSRRCVGALVGWARDHAGADGAAVQVVAANAPAVALYEGLGFTRELFRYHYRRRFTQ
jgi:GNAT superfamily N-acetyltransferase